MCVSVNYACLACYLMMRLMVLFFIFMHLHIASHLHVKDEMLEPNPKTVFDGSIPKMEGLSEC